jgi:hypothetical protein
LRLIAAVGLPTRPKTPRRVSQAVKSCGESETFSPSQDEEIKPVVRC